ncbi:MAG: NAD-dependent epimerase/dehydratase family protein, partial [Bacteroidota bacterium]
KLPKREEEIGNPLSPYAVTKLVNELYAKVFSKTYDLQFIGLRYFNVFGPKQNPNGAYAAVIPLFIKNMLMQKPITINGDGLHSRDFTYIENVVQANLLSLFAERPDAWNEVYNVACGERISLQTLYRTLREIIQSDMEPIYGPPRKGDVRHSLADIAKAQELLGYNPAVSVTEGLKQTTHWYQSQLTVNA